jgi:hypothetical protein
MKATRTTFKTSKGKHLKAHAINPVSNAVVLYQAACESGAHASAAVAAAQFIKYKLPKLECINLSGDT